MLDKFLSSSTRVASKKNAVQSVVRTNVARSIVEKVIELDDKIQEIATQSYEITPDNLISKGIRGLFGIKMPLDISPPKDKTAKSKWHEILKRADEARGGDLERRAPDPEIMKDIASASLRRSFNVDDLHRDLENEALAPVRVKSKETDGAVSLDDVYDAMNGKIQMKREIAEDLVALHSEDAAQIKIK